MEDNEIIRRIKKKDEVAINFLIDKYSKLLFTICAFVLTKENGFSENDIEECISETFFEIWNKPKNFDPKRGSIKTYLSIISKSKSINFYNKNKKNNMINFDEIQTHENKTSTNDIEEFLEKKDYKELYNAINKLKEPSKEILIRRYFFDEKPKDISNKMCIPIKEIENRLYRTKKFLLEELKNYKEMN